MGWYLGEETLTALLERGARVQIEKSWKCLQQRAGEEEAADLAALSSV
jgi:hypothetical protein